MTRSPDESRSSPLFPFLAVLVCAMGALILLLVVTTRRIHNQKIERLRRQSIASAAGEAPGRAGAHAEEHARAEDGTRDDGDARGEWQDAGPPGSAEAAAENERGVLASLQMAAGSGDGRQAETQTPPDRPPAGDQAVARTAPPAVAATAGPEAREASTAESRPDLVVPDLPPPLPEDLSERIEARRLELARLAEQLAAARADLKHKAARIERVQERLRSVEGLLRARTGELEFLRAQIAASGAELQRQKAALQELEAERTRLARAIAELRVAVAERRTELDRQRTRFRIVAFDGSRGTTRRPIVLECERAAIRFVPENVALGPDELNGFTVRFNPLAQGVKALASFWEAWNESHAEPDVAPEPYVLLIVRPSGTVAFYVAQRLLTAAGIPFGYQLLEEDVELDLGPPNPEAEQTLRAAIEPTLQQREKLLAVLARRRRSFGEPLDLGDAGRGFTVANPRLRGGGSVPNRSGDAASAQPSRTGGSADAGAARTDRLGGSAQRRAGPAATETRPDAAGRGLERSNRLRADASWSRFPRRYGVTPADRFFTSDAFRRRHHSPDDHATTIAPTPGRPPAQVRGPQRAPDAAPLTHSPRRSRPAGEAGGNSAAIALPAPQAAERNTSRGSGWPAAPLADAADRPPVDPSAGAAAKTAASRQMDGAEAADSGRPTQKLVGREPPAEPVPADGGRPAGAAGTASGSGAAVGTDRSGSSNGFAAGREARGRLSDSGTSKDATPAGRAITAGSGARGTAASGERAGGDWRRHATPQETGTGTGSASPAVSGQVTGSAPAGAAGLPAAQPELRRWGLFWPDAAIGLERPLRVCVDATSLTVAGQPPRRRVLPDDPLGWTEFVADTVDRAVSDWGPPPRVFYWVPRLHVTVVPGGQPALQRLQAAARRLRLDVDVELRLAPPDWARTAGSEPHGTGSDVRGEGASNAEDSQP